MGLGDAGKLHFCLPSTIEPVHNYVVNIKLPTHCAVEVSGCSVASVLVVTALAGEVYLSSQERSLIANDIASLTSIVRCLFCGFID